MNIKALLRSVEGPEFEAKAAQGGLPGDMWESYSAFANTSGGAIVLGLKEEGEIFVPLGLKSPAKMRKNIFDCLDDRSKISVNILGEHDVVEQVVDGKRLLVVHVPEATRSLKPVYINGNPLRGSFRRLRGADYRCTEEAVRRMWAETVDVRDSKILHNFDLNDLDPASLRAYRNLFRTAAPGHPWQAGGDQELLANLGGWRRDRESGEEGLTLAGLLMFGLERPLLDALPRYQIDYREVDSANPDIRWTYRHTVDGRWSPNLFEFYHRTIARLVRDLAIPFRLQNLQRVDDTHVAEALREAVVNSLIHTDHEASGGIVVTRQPHLFLFENPGDIRIPIEQALAGGVSDCHNPALQRMFRMIGLGDQLGSGVPRMRRAWEEQMWRMPGLWEDVESYRTSLLLPTMSLLPEGAIAELRDLYGEAKFGSLSQDQVLAAVTAHVEGQVSRGRLLAMSAMHPADIAAMLKDMVADGLLTQIQPRRGVYRLPRPAGAEPVSRRQGSSYSADSSSYSADSSSYSADSSLQSIPNTPLFSQTALPLNEPSEDSAVPVASDLDVLRRIAESVATKHWQPRALMREVIVALCRVRPLRLAEMAQLMNRKPESLRQQYLIPLIEERQLQYLYPGEPTHPQQAYTSSDLNRSHE